MSMLKILRISILCVFIGALAFQWWFPNILIHGRPIKPTGDYHIPFEAHGSTTLISSIDQRLEEGSWVVLIAFGFIYAVLYLADPTTAKSRKVRSVSES
jgi:hypothetical protein